MLQKYIDELTQHYQGLNETSRSKFGITLSGPVVFRASFGDHEISDAFDLEMFVPNRFPDDHPVVWESGDRIAKSFGHVNSDKTFCLALPLDVSEVISDDPSLLGFFDNLVVPYLYSYCYWESYQVMPFGERSHGARGFLEYYLERFNSDDVGSVLSGVIKLLRDGYKPHEKCACGSGRKSLRCHSLESKKIAKSEFRYRMILEVQAIIDSMKC